MSEDKEFDRGAAAWKRSTRESVPGRSANRRMEASDIRTLFESQPKFNSPPAPTHLHGQLQNAFLRKDAQNILELRRLKTAGLGELENEVAQSLFWYHFDGPLDGLFRRKFDFFLFDRDYRGLDERKEGREWEDERAR